MRHLQARELLLQEMVQEKMIDVGHVKGTKNPGDLMTKHLRHDVVAAYITMFGLMDMVEANFGEAVAPQTPKTKSWKQTKMLSAIFTLGMSVTQARAAEDEETEPKNSGFDFREMMMLCMVMLSALGF